MWAWILSAMDLTAKLALGSIFWLIALAIVGVVLGLIGAGIAKAMDK
jgi:bacteriorhodopsin